MGYKAIVYALMLLVSSFSLSGINYTGFFKTNHIWEARFFIIIITLALSYLSGSFIINFIELT